jgi:hypothetical protein
MDHRTTFLRRTLATNGVVTLLFGGVLLVDRELIAGLLGLGGALPVTVVGVVCVAFAPFLLLTARKRDLSVQQAFVLVAVDGAWTVASLLVAAVAPLTGVGRALVVAQAGLVAVFMILETAGIRRIQPSGTERVPQI